MQDQKTTIMTKRNKHPGSPVLQDHNQNARKTASNLEYTFVQNSYATDELNTAARASSIGSTDKRSQVSSDSIRKREYMAIT